MLAAIGETYETDAGSKDMGEVSDDLVTGVIVNVRPALSVYLFTLDGKRVDTRR